jgi:hypothetical protein
VDQGHRKLGNKTKGNLVAMEFMCECTRRGAIVSVPLADDHPYDVVVDSGMRLMRVQVKKANYDKLRKRWSCNATRKKMRYMSTTLANGNCDNIKSHRFIPYSPSEIDCLVTRDSSGWYFFTEIGGLRSNKWINPDKPSPARHRWDLIGLSMLPIDEHAHSSS